MTLLRFEVGLVSGDRAIVDFLAEVFELEPLPPVAAGPGMLHKLQSPGAVLKVMIPANPPEAAKAAEPFLARTGLRYLTFFVDDLDAVLARATARRAKIQYGPAERGGGVRIAVIEDPDGNTMEVVQGSP